MNSDSHLTPKGESPFRGSSVGVNSKPYPPLVHGAAHADLVHKDLLDSQDVKCFHTGSHGLNEPEEFIPLGCDHSDSAPTDDVFIDANVDNADLLINMNEELDQLILSLNSPLGSVVNVFESCVKGCCTCVYSLGGIPSQLKPCRFAAIVFNKGPSWAETYGDLVWSITDGFPIVDREVDSYVCENYTSITCPEGSSKMDRIVERELAEGMISIVENRPHCVHALGAVPKSSGGIRQITDCSRPLGISVNNHCESLLEDFCFKSVEDVVPMLEQGYYMSVVDIQAAYRAVPIRVDHRKYQGFSWDYKGKPRWFVENRLCFGLRLGPSYFNHISNFICDILSHTHGLKVVNYLDDFIAVAEDLDACLSARLIMVNTLRYLGFHVSFEKLIYPSTNVIYLGLVIDSDRMELRLPEGKLDKLKSLLDFYTTKDRIYKKSLESIAGYLSHCSHVVKGGRFFCKCVYNLYKEMVVKNKQFIKIPAHVRSDLAWWKNLCLYFNGSSRIIKEQLQWPMVSDSSKKGFAVYLGEDWLAGTWSDADSIPLTSACNHICYRPVLDSFDPDNINELELWPIVVGVKRWCTILRDKSIMVFTDNTQVMHMLLNSGSSNSVCMKWLKELFWVCAIYNIELLPRYINTKCNLVADTLSRLPYHSDNVKLIEYLDGSNLCCLINLFDAYRGNEHASRR